MIGKLRGLIDTIDDDSTIILDVGGVGYLVFCSSRTPGGIAATGRRNSAADYRNTCA